MRYRRRLGYPAPLRMRPLIGGIGNPSAIASRLFGYVSEGPYFQDTAKTTPAANGDPVRVWVASVGADAVTASDAARPVLGSNGVISDTGDESLVFAADGTYTSTGALTCYGVGIVAANGARWSPCGGFADTQGFIRFSDNSLYFSSATGTVNNAGWTAASGLVTGSLFLFRGRRTSANAVFAYASGRASETSIGTMAGNVVWQELNGRGGQITNGSGTLREVWVFNDDLVATGQSAQVEAYFLSKFGVRLGT